VSFAPIVLVELKIFVVAALLGPAATASAPIASRAAPVPVRLLRCLIPAI
jgi:hypothetical protein